MAIGGWRSRALWRVRPYLVPYRRHIACIVTTSLISSAGMVAIPLIVKTVIDGPLADGDRAGVVRWAASRPASRCVEVFLAFSRRYLLTLVSTGLETELRDDLYAQLQRLDVGFHDRWQSGQLLSRAMTDLSIIRRFVGFGAIFFVLITVQVVAIFGSCSPSTCRSRCSPSSPPSRSCGSATASSAVHEDRPTHPGPDRRPHHHDRGGGQGHPGPQGVRPGPEAFAGYQRQATEIYDTQLERIRLHTRFVWVLGVIPNLTLTRCSSPACSSVGSGRLTLGGLVAFVSYVLMLTFPLEILAWIMALAGEAESAAVRIYEVFDTEPTIQDRPAPIELEPERARRGALRGRVVLLRGPRPHGARPTSTSRCEPGEAIAVVGATGSGKTTLVTLLTRLYDPTEGRVTLDGHDLRDLTVTVAAPPRRLRVRGAVAVLGVGAREPAHGQARRHRGRGPARARRRPGRLRPRPARGASTPGSASRACRSRAGSASGSPWPGRSSAGPGCSCSTTRSPRSTSTPRPTSRPPCARCWRAAPCSSSCTARPPWRWPTARSSSTAGRLVAAGTHHDLLASEPRYRAVLSEDAEDLAEEVSA